MTTSGFRRWSIAAALLWLVGVPFATMRYVAYWSESHGARTGGHDFFVLLPYSPTMVIGAVVAWAVLWLVPPIAMIVMRWRWRSSRHSAVASAPS